MKTVFFSIVLFLMLAATALAEGFLTCDPQMEADFSHFTITIDGGMEFTADQKNDLAGPQIWHAISKLPDLPDGVYTLLAYAWDTAGNKSGPSNPLEYTRQVPPNAPAGFTSATSP